MTKTPPTVNVSVVIPCFNNEDTIEHALGSVARQSVRPLEVLVIDDQSTDGSRDVVRRFIECSDLPVQLTALPVNGGPSRARNTGWDQASGEYIAFLDADDAWHPRKLELQYAVMTADPELSISGHTFEVADEGTPFPHIAHISSRNYSSAEMKFRNPFHTSSVFIKRDVPHRFIEQKRHSEDYLLWLQTVLTGRRAVLLDKPLSRMFKAPYGDGGLSAQLHKMQMGEIDVYSRLAKSGLISQGQCLNSTLFSLIKYARRLLVVNTNIPFSRASRSRS